MQGTDRLKETVDFQPEIMIRVPTDRKVEVTSRSARFYSRPVENFADPLPKFDFVFGWLFASTFLHTASLSRESTQMQYQDT
jgi:hypothetical protein